jgi:hypothetical protein
MISSGTYGGGLGGPSIRGGREDTNMADALKRLADLRAGRTPTIAQPKPTSPTAPDKKNPMRRTPAKTKAKTGSIDKVWQVPKFEIPTLLTPKLDVTPTLGTASLQDFNVTPISIGNTPTLEAAPEASPTVRMPDRQDAAIRQAKLAEIAKMKQAKGYGATLLSGGDSRRVTTRRGV